MDAVITVDEVEYELIQPDDMNMREQREFEKIAGTGADRLATLQEDFRAGLIVAWMAVSIKRAKPNIPISQIVDRLDELKPPEMEQAWAKIAEQAGQSPLASEPPPEPSETGSSSERSSESDSELPQANGNQSDTGSPVSAIGSISDRQTSET